MILRPLKAFVPRHCVGLLYLTDTESSGAFGDDASGDESWSSASEQEPQPLPASDPGLRVVADDEKTLIMGQVESPSECSIGLSCLSSPDSSPE